jgi:hypothetical protein
MTLRLAFVVITLLAGGAMAQPAKAPPHGLVVDGRDQWRMITPDFTTSECLGDPKTALCAVETALGCFTRWINRLCRAVYRDPNYLNFDSEGTNRTLRYRIVGYRRIRADQYIYYDRYEHREQVGDYRVVVRMAWCYESNQPMAERLRGACPLYGPEQLFTFLVRPVDDRWYIAVHIDKWVSWRDD